MDMKRIVTLQLTSLKYGPCNRNAAPRYPGINDRASSIGLTRECRDVAAAPSQPLCRVTVSAFGLASRCEHRYAVRSNLSRCLVTYKEDSFSLFWCWSCGGNVCFYDTHIYHLPGCLLPYAYLHNDRFLKSEFVDVKAVKSIDEMVEIEPMTCKLRI